MVAVAAAAFSIAYTAACVVVMLGWRLRRVRPPSTPSASVTVLKPLCGDEPGLEENLRSFCRLVGPGIEILFGARDPDDPALVIARQVAGEFPTGDIHVVAGALGCGANRKVNTLAHLMSLARHDWLVIADSDIRVAPTYLSSVVAPLADPSVGIVSCVYRGRPTDTLWSRLGAMAIDEWFIPSVLVANALGSAAYCSGTTMALRREVLDAAGGFEALAPLLADDYELGARVRRLGFRSVIASTELSATVNEPTFTSLVRHELRWLRTVRTITPVGHFLSFLTYTLPLSLLAVLATGAAPWSWLLPAAAVVLRAALHWVVRLSAPWEGAPRDLVASVWLVPARDILSFALWLASYASRRVTWRGNDMWVSADGVLRGSEETSPA